MRYKQLIEAPIDQYSAVGDWDNPKGSFRSSNRDDLETSHKIIHSPAAVAKIRSTWAKVPQKFNFWMVNDNSTRIQTEIYDISEFQQDNRYKKYADKIQPSPDAINVIYTSNFTTPSNYKPMTAWIMAHRLVHIFQMKSNYNSVYSNIEKQLARIIIDTMRAYGLKASPADTMINLLDNYKLDLLVSRVFTMRSARNNRLTNPLDFTAELLAQHLLNGRIKFNNLPSKLIDTGHTFNEQQLQMFNDRWQNFAKELDQLFDQLLESVVGKVLVL